LQPGGATNIYDTLSQAIQLINNTDTSNYEVSIILMTDGKSNRGSYSNFEAVYRNSTIKPAVYSIMFGDADQTELSKIARITGGKIFDGKSGLLRVFKEVRAYN
jgi:Ca-activated chloride channel family protein